MYDTELTSAPLISFTTPYESTGRRGEAVRAGWSLLIAQSEVLCQVTYDIESINTPQFMLRSIMYHVRTLPQRTRP